MASTPDEYPSWKDAILAEEKRANLRCAVKWLFWQLAYIPVAIVMGLLLAISFVIDAVARTSVASRVGRAARSERAGKAGVVGALGFLGLILAYTSAALVILILEQPIVLVGILAIFGASIIALGIIVAVDHFFGESIVRFYLYVREVLGVAGAKAVDTPGVRRVYGHCPVSYTISPKWFDRLFDRE